jgi:energy-coupling factor transporter ATP-binding protein EcfA2
MYFENQTIEINGNTLITGLNACGKSTIIDALEYLLMGSVQGCKFNSAAIYERGARTLIGYLRGKISTEEQEYLRASDCNGHIAIEITNEQNKCTIIGVVLEFKLGNTEVKSSFYNIEDANLIDEYFITNNYANNFTKLTKYATDHGKKIGSFQSDIAGYRAMLGACLGVNINQYVKLLPKAIGFGSVTTMDTFINQFLLEEDPLDLTNSKKTITDLSALNDLIIKTEDQIFKLNDILERGYIIRERKKNLKILDVVEIYVSYLEFEKQFNEYKDLINQNENALSKKLAEKKDSEVAVEKQQALVSKLTLALENNDVHRSLSNFEEKLSDIKNNIDSQQRYLAFTKTGLSKILNLIKNLISRGYNNFEHYSTDLNINNGSDKLIKSIKSISDDLKLLGINLQTDKCKKEKESNENIETTKLINAQIGDLEKNLKQYDRCVINLIRAINDQLNEKYKRKIEVKPLCEYATVKEEYWRNALEGYLNTQRFDLICDPVFFDDCLKIYDQIKIKQNIYGVGIVNTAKYANTITCEKNSLAGKIDFSNNYARNYAYHLLNKVVCVDQLRDLKLHDNAITSTCMRYHNHVARQINPAIYDKPYLGLEANKLSIEKLKAKLNNLLNEQTELRENLSAINSLLSNIEDVPIRELEYNPTYLASIDNLKQLNQRETEITSAIEKIKLDPSILSQRENLEEEKKKLTKYKENESTILIKVGTLQASIAENRSKMNNVSPKFLDSKTKFDEELSNCLTTDKVFEYYNNMEKRLNKDYSSMHSDIKIKKEAYKTTELEKTLTEMMCKYCDTFVFNAGTSYESLNLYQDMKNELYSKNLVEQKDDYKNMEKTLIKLLEEDYLSKMSEKINDCKNKISALNTTLNKLPFGDDKYKLECVKTKDNEFGRYYDIIMDPNYQLTRMWTDSAEEKYGTDFYKLVDEITKDITNSGNKWLDYRKFLHFDIVIINQKTNIKRHFSNRKFVQSGGENQVPFYIIAAACFEKLLYKYRSDESNLCVVLFDEAFNNMDSQRIKSMMEFYKSLDHIQFFLSLTEEKVPNIVEYMDTRLILVRNDKDVDILNFEGIPEC